MAKLFCTFIGINNYPVKPLSGCVLDVLMMDQLISQLISNSKTPFSGYVPLYLLAPEENELETIGMDLFPNIKKIRKEFIPPTFHNITTRAFDHFKPARSGDTCLFYFSGHGSFMPCMEEFRHLSGTGQSESIVCVDSRAEGHRDIIDVELAYLFWKIFKDKKDTSLVLIMDCCHAGSNTRGFKKLISVNDKAIEPLQVELKYTDLLGHDSAFFERKGKKIDFTPVPHIQLSASQAHESALDTILGGAFTSSLFHLLLGGTPYTYRNVVSILGQSMQTELQGQHPIAYSTKDEVLDSLFLGNDGVEQASLYPVSYDPVRKKWLIHVGKIQGLVKSDTPIIISIPAERITTEVSLIYEDSSSLRDIDVKKLSIEKIYEARLIQSANKATEIGIHKSITSDPALLKDIQDKYKLLANPNYLFVPDHNKLTYKIEKDNTSKLCLSKIKEDKPLLISDAQVPAFLTEVELIMRNSEHRLLNNIGKQISSRDFKFELTFAKFKNNKTAEGEHKILLPGDKLSLSIGPDEKILFDLGIQLTDHADYEQCYVQVIYFACDYSIVSSLIGRDNNLLRKKNKITFPEQDKMLAISPPSTSLFQPSVLLKVIVSNFPVELSIHDQPGIQALLMRSPQKSKTIKKDWAVFDFEINITG